MNFEIQEEELESDIQEGIRRVGGFYGCLGISQKKIIEIWV